MGEGPFSEVLKESTWPSHEEAADGRYITWLLGGRLSRDGYAEMLAQHYFAYAALETAARDLAGHPVAGAFVIPEIYRVPALERDLEFLYGAAWRDRISPSKPTRTYVARIEQVAEWPGGYVAHHYTRYLGDMAGGQVIRRRMRETYGLERRGLESYVFDDVPSLPAFRKDYRARLDALPFDEAERRRVIRETRLAYQLNIEIMDELARVTREHLVA
ncbi:heme oxygenase (biliverdin-producing) [Bailinhaonella thermotolerans]|uniref:Biliverdin-producing heme oxygenase n=1 Tax=Bailinhaonella thermotolerans TaxID=1070861 RepID=A0A3A4B0W7_9ACTN|nr:biliverdin-producing heme oxygenase [Bailinhaonella thermotolerans]RJL31677.1 biliverdin-producing heme oxygenase [Bailinhaonella thermotolerans]